MYTAKSFVCFRMDRSYCDVVKGTKKSAPRAASRTRADGTSKLPESRLVGRESGGLTGNSGSPSQAIPSRSSGVDKVGETLSGNKVGKVKVNPVAVPATYGHASEDGVGWKVKTGKRKRREEKALAIPGPAHPLPVVPKGGVPTGGASRRAPTGPRQIAPSAGGALSKGSGGTSSSQMERNVRSGKASRRPGGVFSGVGNPSTAAPRGRQGALDVARVVGNPSAAAPRGRQGTLDVARVSDLRGQASLGYVSPLAPVQAEHEQHKRSETGFPAPPPRRGRVVSKTDIGTAAETLRGPSQKTDIAQKSRAAPKAAAATTSQQRTRARDVPQGKEAKVHVKEKLPCEKKVAGVSRSKTPLRVSGAKRTAKPRTDSTTAGCDVGKALAHPRVGAAGNTETGQARIDSKRKESRADSQGVGKLRAGNTGTKKEAKVANRADASVKRRNELVSVAKRVLAANETIETLGQKKGVGVRARAEQKARGQSRETEKSRTQTRSDNVGTGTRVEATSAETSRKHGETSRKKRKVSKPKGNGSIAYPVDAHVIVLADAPVPESERSRPGPCPSEAPPPSGRGLDGAGDRRVPPPQGPAGRDAPMGGATGRVAAAHAHSGARSTSTASASLGSAHGTANASSSAEGGASSSLRGPSLPGCAGVGGVNHAPSNADLHVQNPSRSTGFPSGKGGKRRSDSGPTVGGARFSSSAQGAGAIAPEPHGPQGGARGEAPAVSCSQSGANASSAARHADSHQVPSLKRQARFSGRAQEGENDPVLLSNVAAGLNPGQAGFPSSTAHVAPPPNRHVRFSDETGRGGRRVPRERRVLRRAHGHWRPLHGWDSL